MGRNAASLEQFLAGLPELWRQGEARPTHRARHKPRDWRARADPFEGAWPEILLWLQQDPEATAKSLLERLQRQYPGRFPRGNSARCSAAFANGVESWHDSSYTCAWKGRMRTRSLWLSVRRKGLKGADRVKEQVLPRAVAELGGPGDGRPVLSWIYRLGANPEGKGRAASCRPLRSWPLRLRLGRFPPLPYPPLRSLIVVGMHGTQATSSSTGYGTPGRIAQAWRVTMISVAIGSRLQKGREKIAGT